MDISSTTTTAATVMTESSQTTSVQKTSDKSFKDELKKASSEEDTKEVDAKSTTENKTVDKSTAKPEQKTEEVLDNDSENELDQSTILSGGISMSGMKQDYMLNNYQQFTDMGIRQSASLLYDNVPTKVDYSIMQMGADDAQFFTDLVQNTDKTLQNVVADLQSGVEQNVQQIAKNVKVSATLLNALSETVKTNQPFRIDFDNNVSVIIKVDRDGALSARFIPSDKAVEEYLKQNISTLRQRFDEENLSYKDLSYSQQQRQRQRNNKENEHE